MDPAEEAAEHRAWDEPRQRDQSPPMPDGKSDPTPKKTNMRKRTKTGCMTCRRRRIKCDEGKPTCSNCIRSKRHCEGYNQRLTFKEPLGALHHAALLGHPANPLYDHQASEALLNSQLSASNIRGSSSQGPLPAIAPKPPSSDFARPAHLEYGQFYHGQPGTFASGSPFGPAPAQFTTQHSYPAHPFYATSLVQTPVHTHLETGGFLQPVPPVASQEADLLFERSMLANAHPDVFPHGRGHETPQHEADPVHRARAVAPYEAAYWHSDDEASMVESDDNDDDSTFFETQAAHLEANDLGIQVARRANAPVDFYGTQLRTFSGFIDADNVLSNYTPSSTNSPLGHSQTAAVFWYFVNVTGPSMSLYERHPFDPSPMFQGQPVPKARQHIWTYTFPIMSLNHPALLQAILALGSLQMATLQGVPATASMKHYHLCLRRLAKNYKSSSRRTQPATLAATLLLGFYEVWNSDHDKWCKHMWGARAILKEIPLLRMTRGLLNLKRKRLSVLRGKPGTLTTDEDDRDPDITDVDTSFLNMITGSHVDCDYGYGDGSSQSGRLYTERDVDNYENLSDLYWWYCKMDVYQSVLGGTRLFMEYNLWTQCVPRGPMGRIDAVYGSYDHLILLLGRLANFSSLDLARKRQARRAESASKGNNQSPPMFPGLLPSKGKVTVPTGFSPPRDTSPHSEGSEEVDLEQSTADALREWESIRQAFDSFDSRLGPDFDPMGPELGPQQQTPFGPALTYRTYSIAGLWMSYYMGLIVLHRAHPSMPPVATVAAGMAAKHTGWFANEIGRIAAGLSEDTEGMTEVSTSLGAAFIECCFCLFVAGVQYQDPGQRYWTVKRLHGIARLTGWQSARQIAAGCESAWTKAAQLGRGPPYTRAPELVVSVPPSVWTNSRRIDRRIQEMERDAGKYVLTKSEQAHYALGLLSVERDLDLLELRDGG